jgi:hypothetical protein
VPVRYQEEDIPNDFPLRQGDMWDATVDIDTGKIQNWPQGKTGDMHMKVCDGGTYTLLDKDGKSLAEIADYIPNSVVPGEYGDYIELKIDATGTITNWPKDPDVGKFFRGDDE